MRGDIKLMRVLLGLLIVVAAASYTVTAYSCSSPAPQATAEPQPTHTVRLVTGGLSEEWGVRDPYIEVGGAVCFRLSGGRSPVGTYGDIKRDTQCVSGTVVVTPIKP